MGKMHMYRFISIDRFDKENLDSDAFFLSHCHTDHMVGLADDILVEHLEKDNGKCIYASKITQDLLKVDSRFSHLLPFVVPLDIDCPTTVRICCSNVEKFITVTLISAGHCPGSVMFLFEGDEGTCLYTGDFRFPKNSACRLKYLHSAGNVKAIDHCYVDSTFCFPDAYFIPSREDCLKALIDTVSDWITKGPCHVVRINLSAKYGYEYVFETLSQTFKTRIYCTQPEKYITLPSVYSILTTDVNESQIFASYSREKLKVLEECSQWKADDAENDNFLSEKKVLIINLSTMYFTKSALPEEIKLCIKENKYRLCFSFHSSLSEVVDFLTYINPKEIHSNVIPFFSEYNSQSRVDNLLRKLCNKQKESNIECGHESNMQYKPLGSFSQCKVEIDSKISRNKEKSFKKHDIGNKRRYLLTEEDSDDDCSDLFIRKKKCI